MQQPNERVIKKMIDNIVERNRPEFERPAPAESREAPASSAATSPTGAALAPEDYQLLSRKLEYGFNQLRSENADMRKGLEEIGGMIKMLRNDMDNLRAHMRSSGSNSASSPIGQAQPARSSSENISPTAMGAPQYRKTAADEEFETKTGSSSHDDEAKPAQARGFQKKEEAAPEVDISKVFYYGKK